MVAGAKQAKRTMPQEAVAPDASGRPRFHQSWQKLIRGEFVLALRGCILLLSLNIRLLWDYVDIRELEGSFYISTVLC